MLETYSGYADENMVMEFLEDYCRPNLGEKIEDCLDDFLRDKIRELMTISVVNDYLEDYDGSHWWQMNDDYAFNDELGDCSPSELKEMFEDNDMSADYFKWDGFDFETANEDDIIYDYQDDVADWVMNKEVFGNVDSDLEDFWDEVDDIVEYVKRNLITFEVDE